MHLGQGYGFPRPFISPRRLSPMRNRIKYPRAFFLISLSAMLLMPALALAGDVHPLFTVSSTTQSPFPSDFFTVLDNHENTHLRINLPFPDCVTHPSDCLDVALLNQLDGFNGQTRISIPFDGAIDPATVTSQTVFILRVADTLDPSGFHQQTIGINQVVWDPATLTLFVQSD